jgi:hypothetical protein
MGSNVVTNGYPISNSQLIHEYGYVFGATCNTSRQKVNMFKQR